MDYIDNGNHSDPCNFKGRTWIGIGPGEYSNYNETHMLMEVMVNGFDWKQRDIRSFEHIETWQHSSNPLYSVSYIGVLFINVFLLKRFSRKTSDRNYILCSKDKVNTLYKIIGLIFIIAAIYFSVVQFLFFFAFPTMYLSMNVGPLLVYIIIISPIYCITGYKMLHKCDPPRAGSGE